MYEGLRVLDLTHFLAGPYCGQHFADLGAEVIKVEPPGGDLTRTVPPHFVEGQSAYFLSLNRNKSSVVLDLSTPAGREVLLDLIEQSDVLMESFRPGVMERLGVDYAQARQRNPRLIWCSIDGFGSQGPDADRPAYDMIVQAESGVMSLTGSHESGPVRVGVPIGDLAAGMYAAMAISAALFRREREGVGCHLEVPMFSAQLSLLSYLGAYHTLAGHVPTLQGSGHDSIPTYRTFIAGDGRTVVVCAVTQQMWEALAAVLGVPELVDDTRFVDAALRQTNRDALWEVLEPRFGTAPANAWVDALRAARIPVAHVRSVDEALGGATTEALGMLSRMVGPSGNEHRVVGSPIRIDGAPTPADPVRFPPALGEHTRRVLADVLGYGPQRLDELARTGALVQAPHAARPDADFPPPPARARMTGRR